MYDLLPSIGNADIFLRNSHMELSLHCPAHVKEDIVAANACVSVNVILCVH